jgi:glycosyltransferase involved in cell wall biosynthesis
MRKYVVVSPVRDEAQYIEKTILDVLRQTIRPAEWIIVDDGSHDETGRIIDEYAKQYPWIVAVHRGDRGSRLPGTGVMEAFYDGYHRLGSRDWNSLSNWMATWASNRTISSIVSSASMTIRRSECVEEECIALEMGT